MNTGFKTLAALKSGQFSSYTLVRAAAGAPVDRIAPAEGTCAMLSGICKVKDGPNQQAADAFIDEFLGPEIQAILVEKSFVLPINPATKIPAGFAVPQDPLVPDLGQREQEPHRLARQVERGHGLRMSGAAHLRIESVSKRFRGTTVLDGITLDVAQGEFLSLLGCGRRCRARCWRMSWSCCRSWCRRWWRGWRVSTSR